MKYVQQCYMSDMVQALLARRKTQTRRLPNKQNSLCATARFDDLDFTNARIEGKGTGYEYMKAYRASDDTWHRVYYRAEPGDIVWVRESYLKLDRDHVINTLYAYKADTNAEGERIRKDYIKAGRNYQWKPNLHMPKAACRLWLPVTSVRAERLHDISEEDAIAEGVGNTNGLPVDLRLSHYIDYMDDRNCFTSPVRSYASLWDSINGKGSAAANPAVWVQEFTVTDVRPADFLKP